MGIDFIERRRSISGGGAISSSSGSGNLVGGGGIMASTSSSRINGNHNHNQAHNSSHHHHHHPAAHHHQNYYPNNHIHSNGYHQQVGPVPHKHKVYFSDGTPPKENGQRNYNNQSGAQTIMRAPSSKQVLISATSPSSSLSQNSSSKRSFLSYSSPSPSSNGVTSSSNKNSSLSSCSSSNNTVATPIVVAASAVPTPSKPSRTLSVRNFSNFVKRLPSLSLSPSVRIASSLGFSSSNSHNNSNNGATTNSSGPQSLPSAGGGGGNLATLKRPTTVSFQKKKARPFSYAEPGSLNGRHDDHQNHSNGSEYNGATYLSSTSIPTADLSPKGKLENVGNCGATYNGHNVADLEARLARLRVQQLERRKSLDFAISCVEPDPTCFSVEEQV